MTDEAEIKEPEHVGYFVWECPICGKRSSAPSFGQSATRGAYLEAKYHCQSRPATDPSKVAADAKGKT